LLNKDKFDKELTHESNNSQSSPIFRTCHIKSNHISIYLDIALINDSCNSEQSALLT